MTDLDLSHISHRDKAEILAQALPYIRKFHGKTMVIKRQFGHTKVRYRGLAKHAAQLITLFALSNLWMERHRIIQDLQA